MFLALYMASLSIYSVNCPYMGYIKANYTFEKIFTIANYSPILADYLVDSSNTFLNERVSYSIHLACCKPDTYLNPNALSVIGINPGQIFIYLSYSMLM
jgi:hypothetical protein